jgi:hypothetical protein
LRSAEYVFGAAEPLGLDIDRTTVAAETLQSSVRGYAISELAGAESLRRSGLDKEQRREACGPYIQQITESGEYPWLTRIVHEARAPHEDGGSAAEAACEQGLAHVLSGVGGAG